MREKSKNRTGLRTLSAACAFLFLLSLLTSCASPAAQSGDTTGAEPETTPAIETIAYPDTAPAEIPAPAGALDIVKDGAVNVALVIEAEPDSAIDQAATKLKRAIFRSTNIMIPSGSAEGKTYDANAVEILFGVTNEPESVAVLSGLGYGEWEVRVVGHKLVVAAWSYEALTAAVEALTEAYISTPLPEGVKAVDLALPADTSFSGTLSETANDLPHYPFGTVNCVFDCGEDNNELIVTDTTQIEYDTYRVHLAQEGYTCYAENTISNIHTAIYTGNERVIRTEYTPFDSTAHIVILPESALPPEATEAVQKVQPTLTMLGLDSRNGMSFVLQLSDGSFIIYDGGNDSEYSYEGLYKVLREQAQDPEHIEISAWVFTHGHIDHVGGFIEFTDRYADKVTVRNFLYNFPCEREAILSGDPGNIPGALEAMKKYPDAKCIKTYTGDKYSFSGVTIDILYTYADIAPNDLTYFNNSSIASRVTVEGQTIYFPGDTHEDACKRIAAMYGESLKCDIVQTIHHGFAAATPEIYQLLSPSTVLWPAGEDVYRQYRKKDFNKALLELETVKDVYVRGTENVRLTLPYTPTGTGILINGAPETTETTADNEAA